MTAPSMRQSIEDGLSRLRRENEQQFPSQVLEIDSHSDPADKDVLPFPQQKTDLAWEGQHVGMGSHGNSWDNGLVAGDLSDQETKDALQALYGQDFPLLMPTAQDDDWVSWAVNLWTGGASAVMAMNHMVERNRLYYKDIQWVSAVGFGPWREPAKPRDVVRTVRNYIAPALDMRTQLLAEQRPGFSCTPASGDPAAQQKAEANQVALEWSWHEQKMDRISAQAGYHVGTDGVCFLHLYWDPDAGPWYEIPKNLPPEMYPFPIGKKPGQKFPLGDIRTKVHTMEQVRVSADAKANKDPMLWIIREIIPRSQAVMEHGKGIADQEGHAHDETDDDMQHVAASQYGYIMPRPDEQFRDRETVVRITVYADKSEFLPNGLLMVSVGEDLAVRPMALPYGRIPMVRWTDGSPDPSFYPLPCMQRWIGSQQRINAILSKIIEAVRRSANANLIARGNTLSNETLVGGTLNFYEVKAPVGIPLDQIVQPIGPFEVSATALNALAQETKVIEDLTGYNDTTRGAAPGDASGRAILATREQVERVFAPFVNAASRAMCDWAEIVILMMKSNYSLPRLVAVEGSDRPDLARALSSDDLDVAAQVWIDSETLMPMPRSLRLAVLDDLLQKQQISPAEYRRRMPFAMVRSIESPDEDQKARAERVAEAIKRTGTDANYPVLWQDDEAQHQDVLERRIILDDSLPMATRNVADDRWNRLAQQAAMKQQGQPPPPGPINTQPSGQPQAPPGQQPPTGGALPGQVPGNVLQGANRFLGPQQAALGPNSPVAQQPLTQVGLPDQLQAAARFERTAPQ